MRASRTTANAFRRGLLNPPLPPGNPSPDRNRGLASPYPESLLPSSLLPGISFQATRKRASAPQQTGGRWNPAVHPVPSWHVPLLPCPEKFWALLGPCAQLRTVSPCRSSLRPRNRGRSLRNSILVSPHANHTAIGISVASDEWAKCRRNRVTPSPAKQLIRPQSEWPESPQSSGCSYGNRNYVLPG